MKSLRNTTASGIFINDTGVHIDAGETYVIDEPTYLLWAASIEIAPYIASGSIVVNNGSYDLNPNDGIRFLQYPDRVLVKQNGTSVTDVATELNFVGAVSITDNGSGRATISVNSTASIEPCLREVTYVSVGTGLFYSVESNLLFEPDPMNDTIKFYKEETL
jgi:hypothetical protein